MRLILLSGGSGKRLWPLSNDARSKQFLKVLNNANGEHESMVQRVWKQLESVNLADRAVIATSSTQVDMIQNQLGSIVKIVVEPERRDTFPAIALAAAYLYSMENMELDEVVAVLPVDSFAENAFFHRVKELEGVIETSGADLALLGVKPTYPSEKYGYIMPNLAQIQGNIMAVTRFCEKPTESKAVELITQGGLWNCGVFAFKLEYMISHLRSNRMPTDYSELKERYSELTKISFDYEVVEKANNIVALSYEGSWKDLGTWNTLTEEMQSQIIGKGLLSEDSMNTHLINELEIPVIVLGIADAVIAASPDGILLSDKNASPRLKDLVKEFTQRPMYEERRWGWYRVLDHIKYDDGKEILTKRIGLARGENLSYQTHKLRSEIWTIIKGEGEFVLDDKLRKIKAGDVLIIPIGAKHGIKATTDLEFIEVQMGCELVEEDIVRICMTWEEVEIRI
ncbi:Mannose-1-phosphate guanylyltransferase (GDP) [Dehalobacter sp. DCA]|jgi:Mannose-1-phosphate guanylyltransferase|uniref:sugar phosphate nucleotidyltransferase n=1 Tax=Dehalobacter sp. DCA TaxID=1147129 RepID=UPI00028AA05F|nr:sugar phosphate nucleotidyltransferase [Dehalobacter sp. DCA]AFV02102.1 Mannose-1-phosphate guanylyltransferase (GDP) [Dehalobacter sp. DCA]